jgi:predicted NBD/HSP70 family sugar kinase
VKPLRSGSLESLRERNRLRVIDALRERGAVSRADVARQTGLSRSTVSSLVAELQAEGLVVEREFAAAPRGPEGGRPPVLIALDESAGALVGIDFGHRHARVAVSDLSFTVLAERTTEIDVDTAGRVALDLAAGLVCELLDEAGVDRARVLAAGIGIPGPLDRRSGLIQSRGILPSMDGIDTVAEMQDRLDLPVHLDNDANIGALGESTFGAGEGAAVMAYLRLSAGIGAGLVIGGRPFRGAHGVAGEIGHVLVDPQGPICRCGNRGCLETVASGPALLRLVQASRDEELTVKRMIELARDGDAGCRRAIADAGQVVGGVVAGLVNLFSPEMVVIGGDLGDAGDLLLEPLREAVRRDALPAAATDLKVVAGELGERANLLGALALVLMQSEHEVAARVAGSAAA